MPDAWSVVLGDYDRHIESGYEQRIAIDRIVMHDNYENYQHDVVLMRLARPANMQPDALARKICLPFLSTNVGFGGGSGSLEEGGSGDDNDSFDGSSNQLRKLQIMRNGGQSRRRNDKFIKERSVFNRGQDDDDDDAAAADDDARKKYVTNFNQFHFAFDKPTHHHSKSKVNVSFKAALSMPLE